MKALDKLEKTSLWFGVLPYLVHFALPFFSYDNKVTIGLDFFALGFFQTSLSFMFDLAEDNFTSISIAFPWCANLLILLALILKRRILTPIIFALFSIVSAGVFFVNPMSTTQISLPIRVIPLVGSYVWMLSILLLSISIITRSNNNNASRNRQL